MGKLIFVRHGETDKNKDNSLHGTNDPETLNKSGRRQIKLTAEKLATFKPDVIYTSKERRAKESAHIISGELKIPVIEVDGMHERNWGEFTGKSWEDVKKVLDPMTLDERYNYTPKGGESWKTFEARLVAAISNIAKENSDKTVCVVTHGGAIRALIPYLSNIPKEESYKYDPDNASVTIFDFDNKGFTEVTINDTSHLRKKL